MNGSQKAPAMTPPILKRPERPKAGGVLDWHVYATHLSAFCDQQAGELVRLRGLLASVSEYASHKTTCHPSVGCDCGLVEVWSAKKAALKETPNV